MWVKTNTKQGTSFLRGTTKQTHMSSADRHIPSQIQTDVLHPSLHLSTAQPSLCMWLRWSGLNSSQMLAVRWWWAGIQGWLHSLWQVQNTCWLCSFSYNLKGLETHLGKMSQTNHSAPFHPFHPIPARGERRGHNSITGAINRRVSGAVSGLFGL